MAIFITTLSLYNCSLFERKAEPKPVYYDFEQGKYLVSIAEYEKAEPFLLKSVAREDINYAESEMLLGKIYDQTSQPEKAILNLRDYLGRGAGEKLDLLQAQALLIKNLAKVKMPIESSDEKKSISLIVTSKSVDISKALERLRWTLDFNCGVYCVEEINYLKEIQIELIYIIEERPDLYKRVFDILTSRYDYFETYLKDLKIDIEYRKKIAQAMYDALQTLNHSHLETNTVGSVRTAELINYLASYQKRIERWLYE